ncbi:hypothetical protein O3M35_006741 [Rhynocoris fuscipes]|uniref:Uncharacterized protein n=1 Tax=Rhynocoris fuscipes TaxID=488301 RepID=A0AAW1DH30_9HEMI
MIDIRLATASISAALLLPLLVLVSVEALDYKLCPRGNITVHSATTNQILVTPDRCFPIPKVDRNQLSSKPGIQIMSSPGSPFKYTILMVEMNKSYDKYDVFWLETNLTVNNFHKLVRNMSQPRDVTKMVEYRPPKASAYNLTYLILVYKQSPLPVEVPRQLGQFKPNLWATNSHLTLVGGAEFIVAANQPLNPAHHQTLPAVMPSYPVVNAGAGNSTYRNYTNSTYPRPPPYNPSYHPQQPPQPPPQQPYQPYQPPQHQPYPVHPATGGHNKKGHKGAAAELKAASCLVTLLAFITFNFNI